MIDASAGFMKDGPKNRLRDCDIHKIVDVFNRRDDSDPIHGEMDRISQALTRRVKELAERYETSLPVLTDNVAALNVKVEAHLQKWAFIKKISYNLNSLISY